MSEFGSTTRSGGGSDVVDDDHDDEPFGTTPLPTSLPIRGSDGGGGGTGNGIGPSLSSSSAVVVVPVSITLDMDPILSGPPSSTVAQQPHTQQIAVYEATPNEACINGSLLDVNQHFVVYAVKNGLIRVLHRHSAMRALLRGHAGQVITDIRFFLDGDVLGTVGSTGGGGGGNDGTLPMSTLIVWRVFEQSPEIMSEKLLEISSHPGLSGTAPDLTMSRLLWHPFNPNQFWMVHSIRTTSSSSSLLEVATLVETTRIQTRVHPADGENHALCLWHSPYCVMDGALQLIERPGSHNGGAGGNLTDLAWSGRDTRHVLTVHDNGSIILWDLKQKTAGGGGGGGYGSVDSDGEDGMNDDVTVPKRLFVLHEDGVPHSRCCFLPHDDSVRQDEALRAAGGDGSTAPLTTCFATAAHQNTVVTLWSAFTSGNQPPTKLQEVNLVPHPTRGTVATPTSFVMDVCFGPAPPNAAPPSCFLLFGSRQEGRLLALHVRSVWSQEPMQHQHQQDVVLKPKERALCVGVDYVVPFTLKHPIYSWSVVCSPTQDIAEEEIQERAGLIFDMKAFAYQSKVVQCLTLTSYMCLPPEHGYKSGSSNSSTIVRVEQLKGKYVNTDVDVATNIRSTTTTPLGLGGSSTPSPLDADYGEDYDIDDEFDNADGDDDDDDDVDDAAAVAGRPVPTVASAATVLPTATGNPFANWLGAIATNSSLGGPFPNGNASGMPLPPPPPPPPPPSTPATGLEGIPMPPPGLAPPATVSGPNGPPSFLSPMDLFQPPPAGNEPSTVKQDTIQQNGKDKKKKGRQNSPKRSKSPKGGNKKHNNNDNNNKMPFPDGKVAILRRDGVAPAHASAAVPPPIPNDPSVLSDPAILAAAGIPVMDHFAVTPAPPPPQLPTTVVSTIDPDVLREQVAQAVEQALASVVVPTVNKAIKESFVSLARPLQLSMDTLRKQGVTVDSNDLQKALNVETPLKAAMAETMRNSLVPALESITAQILNQVQTSMPPPPPDQSKALDLLVQQVAGMSTKMDALTKEVQVLRTAVANQAAAAAAAAASSHGSAQTNPPSAPQAPAPTQQPAMLKLEQTRNEITHLLSVEQYEAAFTKAVSASTADMAVFACARADLSKVLGGSAPTLSQPILLCLMQQLGAALPGTTSPDHLSLELSWLQEIALTLNPSEPSIQRHVPTVLQQLVGSINGKMSAEGNGQIRRKLQMLLQVLRGMQLG